MPYRRVYLEPQRKSAMHSEKHKLREILKKRLRAVSHWAPA